MPALRTTPGVVTQALKTKCCRRVITVNEKLAKALDYFIDNVLLKT